MRSAPSYGEGNQSFVKAGTGAVNDLSPQIMVGTSTYAAKRRLPAGRILAGYQANPGPKFPARTKVPAIINSCYKRGSDHRAYAWQRREPTASLLLAANGDELDFELVDRSALPDGYGFPDRDSLIFRLTLLSDAA